MTSYKHVTEPIDGAKIRYRHLI